MNISGSLPRALSYGDGELTLQPIDNPPFLSIIDGDRIIFQINRDGSICYSDKNGDIKIMENEKELSLIFVLALGYLSGVDNPNKEEIIKKVITNYREGRLDNLLS